MFRGRSEDVGQPLTGVQPAQDQQQQQIQRLSDHPGRHRRRSSSRRRAIWHRLIHSISGLNGIINDRFKIKIYCDWANHYLDKSNCDRFIIDLQTDLVDGILLADVIRSVTNNVVRDIDRSPTSPQKMTENVQKCIDLLDQLGIDVQEIDVDAIRQGHVKTILQLFFSLSRYKQQQKLSNSSVAGTSSSNVSKATAMQVSESPSQHRAERPVEGDDIMNDDDIMTSQEQSWVYHDDPDDPDGFYDRPLEGAVEGHNEMTRELKSSTSNRTSSGTSLSESTIGHAAIVDAANGNIESAQSRLPKKRSSNKQIGVVQRRLPTYSSSLPTSMKSTTMVTQCDVQVPSTGYDCRNVINDNVDVNIGFNSGGHRTGHEDRFPSQYGVNKLPGQLDNAGQVSNTSTAVGNDDSTGNDKPHQVAEVEKSNGDGQSGVIDIGSSMIERSVDGAVRSASTAAAGELSSTRSGSAVTGFALSLNGRKARTLPGEAGGISRSSNPGSQSTAAANQMLRSVRPLDDVNDDDETAANRISVYDNVETPFIGSTSSSVVRRRPTAAISRLAVSATNLIGMLGGGVPSGSDSPMLTNSSAIRRAGSGTTSGRYGGSTTLAASCDNVATCSSSNDVSLLSTTCTTSQVAAVVGSGKPSSKTTPSSATCRTKPARAGMVKSRRPASDGGTPAATTNLPVKTPGSTGAISGAVSVVENSSLKHKTTTVAAKQRTLTLPIRSTSLSLVLNSPTSSKMPPNCLETSHGARLASGVGPVSPALTPTSQMTASRFHFGVLPKSGRGVTTSNSTSASASEPSSSSATSANEEKSHKPEALNKPELNAIELANDKNRQAVTGTGDGVVKSDDLDPDAMVGGRSSSISTSENKSGRDDMMNNQITKRVSSPRVELVSIHEEQLDDRLERLSVESDDSGEYRRMDSDDDDQRFDDVSVATIGRCTSLLSGNNRDESAHREAATVATSSCASPVECSKRRPKHPAETVELFRRPSQTESDGNVMTRGMAGISSAAAATDVATAGGEEAIAGHGLKNVNNLREYSTSDESTRTGSDSNCSVKSTTVDAKTELSSAGIPDESNSVATDGEFKELNGSSFLPPPMEGGSFSSTVWLTAGKEQYKQPLHSELNSSTISEKPPGRSQDSITSSPLTEVVSTGNPAGGTMPSGGKSQHHRTNDDNTHLSGVSEVPAVTRVASKSYGGRKMSRDVIVRPMRSIRESPEMGTTSMSPVERGFFDADENMKSPGDNGVPPLGDSSRLSDVNPSVATVWFTADNVGRHQVASASSGVGWPTQQTSNSPASPVPDRQRLVNGGHQQLARPTGLTRSSSERTPRPSHQSGLYQPGMSLSVHVVPASSSRRTSDSMCSNRVSSPLSHYPQLAMTTSSNDVPWWWTAAEKTFAASASRSSTLPRTIRDSIEQNASHIVAGEIAAKDPSVSGIAAPRVDTDKCMERRRISMGSESYHHTVVSSASTQPTSKVSSVRSDNVKAMGGVATAKEESHRATSALTVVTMDVNGRCKTDNQKAATQKLLTTRQLLAVPTTPSSTSTSVSSPSMPMLTQRQLCGDAERLSNHRQFSEDPNIKFRHSNSPLGSPKSREGMMTSPKPCDLAMMTSPKPCDLAMMSPKSMDLVTTSSSSFGSASVGGSASARRFRERWLASDGSSTENLPASCVAKTTTVAAGLGSAKNASSLNVTSSASVMPPGLSPLTSETEHRQHRDAQTQRQSRRKLDATRSAEQLPVAALSKYKYVASDSTVINGTKPRGSDTISTNSTISQCRDGGGGSNGSDLSGNVNEVFVEGKGDFDGGSTTWLMDCERHLRNDISKTGDSHGSDYRGYITAIGGPGASNSVPRGMSLCTTKSPSTSGVASNNPQNASDMAVLGGAMTTSAMAGLCITCSRPSPKRSLSNREDDWHGSMLSLISNTSSVYSTAEEKQAQEVRKLKRDLDMAQEKINTLTTQLSTNVHVVTAFEKSLANMTQRLQKLASASEQKDSELNQLKFILRSLHDKSKRQLDGNTSPTDVVRHQSLSKKMSLTDQAAFDKHVAIEALSLAGAYDGIGYYSDSLTSLAVTNDNTDQSKRPQSSSSSSQAGGVTNGETKKLSKMNWLKMSLTKAFQRSRRRGVRSKKAKTSSGRSPGGAWSDTESEAAASSVRSAAEETALSVAALSMPNSPNVGPRQSHRRHPSSESVPPSTPVTPSINEIRRIRKSPQPQQLQLPASKKGGTLTTSSSGLSPHLQPLTMAATPGEQTMNHAVPTELVVIRLQQQLREKDLKLTDVRLEALSSAHQLDSLRDAMNRMKNEISSLKSENERMQRAIKDRGHEQCCEHSSSTMSTSLTVADIDRRSTSPKRISLGDPTRFEALAIDSLHKNAHHITVSVQRAYTDGDLMVNHHLSVSGQSEGELILIGEINLNSSTNWNSLDNTVRRLFKKHVRRLDPGHGLGLGGSSILLYRVGEIVRCQGSKLPDLLPCGYLVGDNNSIIISLKGPRECSVDTLAFETLIPKSVVQRYVALLVEHRRVIICGPTGTGKTYLARRLAETLVLMSGRELKDLGVVSTFNLDQKSGRELRQYLASVADQCLGNGLGIQTSTPSSATTPLNSLDAVADGGIAAVSSPGSASSLDTNDGEGGRPTRANELLPVVVVLDNLQHVGPAPTLADSFQALLGVQHQACPYIIGTLVQSSSTSTGGHSSASPASTPHTMSSNNLLQMHHNFRWIIYSNHVEPVAGFLARYLQRRLVAEETRWSTSGFTSTGMMTDAQSGSLGRRRPFQSHYRTSGGSTDLMMRVIDWLPRMWQHVNRFIESRCGVGTDVTIGPRLFMTCPMDYHAAHQWFTDLWNYSIIPYLIEAFRDGSATVLHGIVQSPRPHPQMSSSTSSSLAGRAPHQNWQDPTEWVIANYPWTLPSSATSTTTVSGSLSSSVDSSCSSALGVGRPLSLLRLRPEDLGFVATDSLVVQTQPAAESCSGQGDVRQEVAGAGDVTPGRHQMDLDWSDSHGDDGTHGSCRSAESIDEEIREAVHDGIEENDVSLYHHNASIAFDPLTNMLLRLQEAAGSASPAPSIDDWSSDTSTGSGSTATEASTRVAFRRRRRGDVTAKLSAT